MKLKRGFASDNNSGIHPDILQAIERANRGHCVGYGDDPFTESAAVRFREAFGEDVRVYFVFTGTGANVLGLRALCSPHQSILCSSCSHLNVDECGAPENFIGAKLLTVRTGDGKLNPRELEPFLRVKGDPHHSQPAVVSITQATELGTVYSRREIEALGAFARDNGLYLHMDGARIANAAASLGCGLRELTRDAGVDVLSMGGTKSGMMIGEAVVFFNPGLAGQFKYIRKQGMQLASKMRFISAQFEAFLNDDLWLKNARHANAMARRLAEGIREIPGCSITQKVEANAVFVIIPRQIEAELRNEYFFYTFDETGPVIRLMTSFDTDVTDIEGFLAVLKRLMT